MTIQEAWKECSKAFVKGGQIAIFNHDTHEYDKYPIKPDPEAIAVIEKDLKVLEILKSHVRLSELNSVYMGYPKTIVIAIEPNDDDYEIVKRWLENERN